MINEHLLRAYYFAQEKHKGQTYGDGSEPFTTHLREVVNEIANNFNVLALVMGDFPDRQEVEAAGWLHDTLEDTDTTREELVQNFGDEIAEWVWCVTDSEGNNRKEKKRNTWHKIRSNKVSTFIKLCDRLANSKRSIGTKFEDMYRKEFPLFEAALFVPGEFDGMWEELKGLTYDKR